MSLALLYFLLFIELLIGIICVYLLVLTIMAFVPQRKQKTQSSPTKRFAIMIPAHNEELLLGRLLESVNKLEYPPELFRAYVVADNCSDTTAQIAREHGAEAFERNDTTLMGKGHALNWLLKIIAASKTAPDAYIIVDADSVLSKNFLAVMNQRLLGGSTVIQAYYTVANPTKSWMASLRFVALALVHYLRPKGKSILGASAGLKGNGMCFSAALLEGSGWNAFAIVEDVEYHLKLVESGKKVDFDADAVVEAEMPSSLRQAQSQNLRWERGRLQMALAYSPQLLFKGIKTGNIAQIEAAIEQLVPPLSLPIAFALLCLIGSLLVGAVTATYIAIGLLAVHFVYVVSGLVLVHAPLKVCLALACAPIYIIWKIWLYLVAMVSANDNKWVRTSRT